MISLQKIFLPEGYKFFKLFDMVADNLVHMGDIFYTAIYKPEKPFQAYMQMLDKYERDNDDLTHKLFIELGRNFITPYDREDIHYMAKGLDDIADLSFGIIRQMNSYGLTEPVNITKYVAGEFKRLVELLSGAVKRLSDKRNLSALGDTCVEMKKIIVACDSRVDAAIYGLFPSETDVVGIIKWMEHFELLQVLMEKCENVVHTIESIIIKYS
jgi:uncharacterized protein